MPTLLEESDKSSRTFFAVLDPINQIRGCYARSQR